MANVKKRRAVLILCLSLALILLACGAAAAVLAVREAPYRRFNAMLEQPAKALTLTVTSDLQGDVLHAEYRISNGEGAKDVRYTYEQLAAIKLEGDEILLPPSRIESKEGHVRISGGRVVLLDGEQPNLSTEVLTLSRLRFAAKCFREPVDEAGKFYAEVTDPAALFGFAGDAVLMQLTLTYAQERVEGLTLEYKNERGEAFALHYTFEY